MFVTNTCATLALWKEAHCSSVAGAPFLAQFLSAQTTVDSTLIAGCGWHRAHHARARTGAPRHRAPRRVGRASRALGRSGLCRLRALRQGGFGCWKLENQTVRSNASVLWGAGTARLLASA